MKKDEKNNAAGQKLPDYGMVKLDMIVPDENQPRKFFDQAKLKELAESIVSQGVLQPILLRPFKSKYKIVCGGRRYRASLMVMEMHAERDSIPATIRKLSDIEALDIQIVENLQRADVEPLEEAVAFKQLHVRYTIEEISHKVGKNTKYVAGRIRINDLADGFKEMLGQHKMTITQALQLCRLLKQDQESIFKHLTMHGDKHWRSNSEWKLGNFDWLMRPILLNLDNAPFKTEDLNLYPEMGACNKCIHNTANDLLLFSELSNERFCKNKACFEIKKDRAYAQEIDKAIDDPDIILLACVTSMDAALKGKIKAIEERGGEVKLRGDVKILDEKEAKAGKGQRAYVVEGNWEAKAGSYVMVMPSKVSLLEKNSLALDNKLEIERLQEREKRNQELDRDKVYKKVMPVLERAFTNNTSSIHNTEWKGLLVMLANKSSQVDQKIKKLVKPGKHMKMTERIADVNDLEFHSLMNQLIRTAVFHQLVSDDDTDYEQNEKPDMMMQIAKLYIPGEVDAIEAAQKEVADKRKGNVEKRIGAIKNEDL